MLRCQINEWFFAKCEIFKTNIGWCNVKYSIKINKEDLKSRFEVQWDKKEEVYFGLKSIYPLNKAKVPYKENSFRYLFYTETFWHLQSEMKDI